MLIAPDLATAFEMANLNPETTVHYPGGAIKQVARLDLPSANPAPPDRTAQPLCVALRRYFARCSFTSEVPI